MLKKILIIVALLSIIVLSGCDTNKQADIQNINACIDGNDNLWFQLYEWHNLMVKESCFSIWVNGSSNKLGDCAGFDYMFYLDGKEIIENLIDGRINDSIKSQKDNGSNLIWFSEGIVNTKFIITHYEERSWWATDVINFNERWKIKDLTLKDLKKVTKRCEIESSTPKQKPNGKLGWGVEFDGYDENIDI